MWARGGNRQKKLLVTRTDRRCITEAGDPMTFAKRKTPGNLGGVALKSGDADLGN